MSCSALAGGSVILPRPMRGYGKDYGGGSGESQTGGGIWLRIESNCFSNSGKSFVATFQTSS